MKSIYLFILLLFPLNLIDKITGPKPDSIGTFESIPPRKSGIRFQNTLTAGQGTNILTYEYLQWGRSGYRDINNDGLDDIYFTGNMVPNQLYLNEEILNSKTLPNRPVWKVKCLDHRSDHGGYQCRRLVGYLRLLFG